MRGISMRKAKVHWGSCGQYRVISFSDGTAELQEMKTENMRYETLQKGPQESIFSAHLHWLVGCEGKVRGYREL
jgi:hypothetical protein